MIGAVCALLAWMNALAISPERERMMLKVPKSEVKVRLERVALSGHPGLFANAAEFAALKAKEQGKILHIGITNHQLAIANEAIDSGLFETLQFPFSYLSAQNEQALVRRCAERGMGFIAMKGLCGGLLTNSAACAAFMSEWPTVLPIWGVQHESELEEWLGYLSRPPVMDEAMRAFIEADRAQLGGEFCRSCGYCMPCPAGIEIRNCARMIQLLRRMPSGQWLNEHWQAEMKKIEGCLHCGRCVSKCPYHLNTPELLRKNYDDYQRVLRGEVKV